MTYKKVIIAKNIIFVLGLICPCILALLFSFILLFVGWDNIGWTGHTNEYFFVSQLDHIGMGIVFVFALLVVIVLLFYGIKHINKKKTLLLDCILVYAFSAIVRIALLLAIRMYYGDLAPFSDFAQVWEIANGNMASIQYKSIFAAWMNFAYLERVFVLGFGNDYFALLICNCLISSLTTSLLYLISRLSGICSYDCAVLASLLYSVYFPSVFFSMIGAPDIIVVPLYLLAILLLIGVEKHLEKECWTSVALAFIAGIIVGFSSAYKSFGVVVIIAFIIIGFISLILNNTSLKNKLSLKRIGLFVLCAICLISTYCFAKDLILKQTEKSFAVELDYSKATPHYLLVGLNTQGEGQIHIGNQSRIYYQNIIDAEYDEENARKIAYKTIIEDWKEDENPIEDLVIPKLIWAWQDDTMPFRYIVSSLSISSESNIIDYDHVSYDVICTCIQMIYMTVMFLAAIGIIVLIKRKTSSIDDALIVLIVIGYFFITLISEAQSRYKFIVMPLMCIIASIGFCALLKYIIGKMREL